MIKLELDRKWKYLKVEGFDYSVLDKDKIGYSFCYSIIYPIPNGLYHIHHTDSGMFLEKVVDIPGDGESIMVADLDRWIKCYSTGMATNEGHLMVYKGGKTKWSSSGKVAFYKEWRRPTKEELE